MYVFNANTSVGIMYTCLAQLCVSSYVYVCMLLYSEYVYKCGFVCSNMCKCKGI